MRGCLLEAGLYLPIDLDRKWEMEEEEEEEVVGGLMVVVVG